MEKTALLPREEYKYYVPRSVYPHLLEDLNKFTAADSNAERTGGFYEITSFYFENRDMKSYFDKIDGLAKRVKLRLRFYPLNKNTKFNIEFKYKMFDKCLKEKTNVDYDSFLKMLHNRPLDEEKFKADPVILNFLNMKKVNNFLPFIRIDYKRKALFGRTDKKVRITFDYDVKCCRLLPDTVAEPYIPALPQGNIILEIKTPGYFPFWLAYIIKKYSLKKNSVSKYALSVQNLALNSAFNLK